MPAKRSRLHPKRPIWEFILLTLLLVGLVYSLIYFFWTRQGTFLEPRTEIVATYKGRIPCADCPGIDATITFYRDNTYYQVYVYEEKNVTSTTKGTWNILKGTPADPSSWVYELTPWGTTNTQDYLVKNSQLIPLSSNLKPIPAPYNAPLIKQ